MPLLVRITTVPVSMKLLLKGQPHFMKQNGFDVIMISSGGAEVEELVKQENCEHIIVPFTRKIDLFRDFSCLVKLILIFRKLKPDIVHTHTPKAGLLGMLAAFICRVPVRLHTVAGLPWLEKRGLLRTLLIQIERLTSFAATRIYPNSKNLSSILENEKIANGKLKVLGNGTSNGINTDHFYLRNSIVQDGAALRAKDEISDNSWVWIFAGRIVKEKGIGELIDSFIQVHKKYPGDKLWMLGEEEPSLDPLTPEHRKIINDHPGIRTWGFVNDVRPYFAASQVLVFPSYREGFPNVPLQAGAMKCMLLLSDINGCNEIVTDKVNGLLVSPKSVLKLAEAMFYIRNNPAARMQFINAAHEHINNNYSQQAIWNLLLAEYNEFLLLKKEKPGLAV